MLLKLGEAGSIQILVSAEVLAEAEVALRRKAPQTLGLFALLLDKSRVKGVSAPELEIVSQCQTLISHPGDAAIVAAAWAAGVDYFVTLDKEHLLNNSILRSGAPFPIGTPGDCLAWYREQLH